MTSRREFLRGLAYGSVTTPVAFRDGWERVIEDATRGLDRRSAAEIAVLALAFSHRWPSSRRSIDAIASGSPRTSGNSSASAEVTVSAVSP